MKLAPQRPKSSRSGIKGWGYGCLLTGLAAEPLLSSICLTSC